MAKWVIPWIAVAGAIIAGHTARNTFGIPEQTIWLATTAVALIIVSFHLDGRVSALEARVIHKDYAGIIAAIEEGDRHKPLHKQPKSLIEGGAVPSFITVAHQVLFDDFRWFGAAMNQNVAEAWSIEELNDTDVRGVESPEVGRRYQVYYNACKMGTMQVTVAGFGAVMRPEEFEKDRQARVELEISYLRFVPFGDALSLVREIAILMGSLADAQDTSSGRPSNALALSNAALTEHLWESVRNADIDPSFEFRAEGPYEVLRELVTHWKSNGIDPYERWAGDRSWN
ncbi:MAG: hypothetical protein KF723_21445 [Rhizobiaceae bacterium]|nr:hypothetical protein [Rhizobiaceae bacterium]